MRLPAGYTLRRATPADAPLIQTQRDAMFVDMGKDPHKLQQVHTAALGWHRRMLQTGLYEGFLVESEGEVVAGAGLLWRDWPPNPDTTEQTRAYILNVYVQPPHRGKGLAQFLIEEMLAECALRGVHVVSLHASEAGRPIYERLGFRSNSEMELVLP
ncbi:GNAT family N-acetyltransferase [Deinococcus sp. Arct2-2]|uniref:GNAT family N-acetyltransferase n=1 Tax=Deinococcus sp. Arct2-2 TaxID=2568653 RepID=UPI0010A2B60D|nr:GNAT family N-acetyltransferase [Deinococcus sp. Arct2-2]THF68290.1 GNAT family N-acetyltransferase [Deinococcus sp. Arct2-2]